MSASRLNAPRVSVLVSLIVLTAASVGCASGYQHTPLPQQATETQPVIPPRQSCPDALTSYAPGEIPPPGKALPGSTMAKFIDRGRLVFGVSGDALPMAARNPLNGQIEGFEIDLAKAITKALLGDEAKMELRVLTPERVVSAINDGEVDLVIRQVGIGCESWRQHAASAAYATTSIQVLTKSNANIRSVDDLRGRSICAARASIPLTAVANARLGARVDGAADTTQCMVKFQRGEVDMVAGDSPVLFGLRSQDPFATVAPFNLGTNSYGVAARADRADLVSYVNAILARWESSGQWGASWDKWAGPFVGGAKPPPAVYGRSR